MKKSMLTVFIFSFLITFGWRCPSALAESYRIVIGGFNNYAPLGYINNDGKWKTIFEPAIEKMLSEIDGDYIYNNYDITDVDNIARDIREAKVDMFVGAYNQTEEFENLYLLFPAIVYNPVAIFVLPSRASEIKNINDIKNLKGGRYKGEVFNDFIENKLQSYNLEKIDTSYDMFEKLFTKKIDYILSGYYFGMIEAIKLGVNHQIATSKQTLLNIPIFVGVAQMSPYRDMIANHISRYFQAEEEVNVIKDGFRKILEEFEKEYAGVVPPTFGLESEDIVTENNEDKGDLPAEE